MRYLIFISTFIVTLCGSFCTEMDSCSKSNGIFPNVTYSINSYVCESSPCLCILGCPAVVDVNFVAPRYLERMTPKAHASCMGVELDYYLQQDDACDGFTNTQCPIVKNEKVNYKYELNIPAIFPEVTVTLQFSLVDQETNEDVLCFVFDILVQRTDCPP